MDVKGLHHRGLEGHDDPRRHHRPGDQGNNDALPQQGRLKKGYLDSVKPGGYSLTQQTQGSGDDQSSDQAPEHDPMNPTDSAEISKSAQAPAQAASSQRPAPAGSSAGSDPGELRQQLGFLYPSVGEILHNDPSKLDSGTGFTLNPQQQSELNDYGDKIKNVLSWNIMTQMLVKGSQMAMDSFLLAEKWQYEQQITVMQFMQTMAQMSLSYINNMSQGWDQLWNQYKQKQSEVNEGTLQAIAGGR